MGTNAAIMSRTAGKVVTQLQPEQLSAPQTQGNVYGEGMD